MRAEHYPERSAVLTDDAAQLTYERQRLRDVETKLARAKTTIDRWYYTQCVAGWQRSIAVLERRINDEITRSS